MDNQYVHPLKCYDPENANLSEFKQIKGKDSSILEDLLMKLVQVPPNHGDTYFSIIFMIIHLSLTILWQIDKFIEIKAIKGQ